MGCFLFPCLARGLCATRHKLIINNEELIIKTKVVLFPCLARGSCISLALRRRVAEHSNLPAGKYARQRNA